MAAVLLVLGLGSLAGIVDIRLQMLSAGNASWSAALLYIAMQGGVELAGSAVHGWWQHNPRVRQIRATEQRIAEAELAGEDSTDRITELSDWEETLVQFQMTDWLASRRAALADRYASAVLRISRNTRCHELSRLGHHDAVSTVQMLPMPKFIPPVDLGSDDIDDWLSGPLLTLMSRSGAGTGVTAGTSSDAFRYSNWLRKSSNHAYQEPHRRPSHQPSPRARPQAHHDPSAAACPPGQSEAGAKAGRPSAGQDRPQRSPQDLRHRRVSHTCRWHPARWLPGVLGAGS